MKADKRCTNCEFLSLQMGTCKAGGPIEKLNVCFNWSANLEYAACGRCVYGEPYKSGKEGDNKLWFCQRNPDKKIARVEEEGRVPFCGDFVPGVT